MYLKIKKKNYRKFWSLNRYLIIITVSCQVSTIQLNYCLETIQLNIKFKTIIMFLIAFNRLCCGHWILDLLVYLKVKLNNKNILNRYKLLIVNTNKFLVLGFIEHPWIEMTKFYIVEKLNIGAKNPKGVPYTDFPCGIWWNK